ncbi:MAG: hypothetical protein ACO3PO_14015, partial [Limisphaerales bacterium]
MKRKTIPMNHTSIIFGMWIATLLSCQFLVAEPTLPFVTPEESSMDASQLRTIEQQVGEAL